MRLPWITKSIVTILRIFVVYKPFRFFLTIGIILFLVGTIIGVGFLWYYFTGSGAGLVQSLILASILIGIGFQTIVVAFLADLLSVNRRLLEDIACKENVVPNEEASEKGSSSSRKSL